MAVPNTTEPKKPYDPRDLPVVHARPSVVMITPEGIPRTLLQSAEFSGSSSLRERQVRQHHARTRSVGSAQGSDEGRRTSHYDQRVRAGADLRFPRDGLEGFYLRGRSMQRAGVEGVAQALQSLAVVDETVSDASSISVGPLGVEWRFPTDHLPIGCVIDECFFCSLNVLNTRYVNEWFIFKNTQGLNGSNITELHTHISSKPGLTMRDLETIRLVHAIVQNERYPSKVIALQECSDVWIKEMRAYLPEHMALIPTYSHAAADQCVIIYDRRKFDLSSMRAHPIFAEVPYNNLMEVVLTDRASRRVYSVNNVHLPGDPQLPAKEQLMQHMLTTWKRVAGQEAHEQVMVVLGDMNFDGEAMDAAAQQQVEFLGDSINPFSRVTPYRTNVGPDFSQVGGDASAQPLCAKAIDHIFVASNCETKREDVPPEAILPRPYDRYVPHILQLFASAHAAMENSFREK